MIILAREAPYFAVAGTEKYFRKIGHGQWKELTLRDLSGLRPSGVSTGKKVTNVSKQSNRRRKYKPIPDSVAYEKLRNDLGQLLDRALPSK